MNDRPKVWLAALIAAPIGVIMAVGMYTNMSNPNAAVPWLVVYVFAVIAVIILYAMASGAIDLKYLISEENGQASMSRFQLLIFTLVISMGLLVIILRATDYAFPNVNNDVLGLIGISAGSYLGSKITQRTTPPVIPDAFARMEEQVVGLEAEIARAQSVADIPVEVDEMLARVDEQARTVRATIAQTREEATGQKPTELASSRVLRTFRPRGQTPRGE